MLLLGVSLLFAIPLAQSQTSPTSRTAGPDAQTEGWGISRRQTSPILPYPNSKAIVALEPNNVDARRNLGVLFFFKGAFSELSPTSAPRSSSSRPCRKYKPCSHRGIAHWRRKKALFMILKNPFPTSPKKKIRIDTGMQLIEIYSGQRRVGQSRKQRSEPFANWIPPMSKLSTRPIASILILRTKPGLSLSVVAPQSGQMHQMMAHELAKQGNNAAAIANYREATKLAPQLPGIHFELAEMLNARLANR